MGAASGSSGGSLTLQAMLTAGGEPLAGQTVRFSVGGSTQNAQTDMEGRASATFSLADWQPGSYQITVSFAGNAADLPTTTTATLTVTQGSGTSAQAVQAQLDDLPGLPEPVAELLQRVVSAVLSSQLQSVLAPLGAMTGAQREAFAARLVTALQALPARDQQAFADALFSAASSSETQALQTWSRQTLQTIGTELTGTEQVDAFVAATLSPGR